MEPVLKNEWFIPTLEREISEKIAFIRFLTEDITLNTRLREKYNDQDFLVFELNCTIESEADYIKMLSDSIFFLRRLMDDHRKRIRKHTDRELARAENRA